MTWFTALVAVLASFRVAYMISHEEGPFSIFSRLRGRIDPNQATWVGRGLNCGACVSVWTSLIVVLMILYLPQAITTPLMFWLAVACGALLLNRWVNK